MPKAQQKLVAATLVKMATDNGFWHVRDDKASVGKSYTVDMNSIKDTCWYNLEHRCYFTCSTINAKNDKGEFLPMPTELLNLENL